MSKSVGFQFKSEMFMPFKKQLINIKDSRFNIYNI